MPLLIPQANLFLVSGIGKVNVGNESSATEPTEYSFNKNYASDLTIDVYVTVVDGNPSFPAVLMQFSIRCDACVYFCCCILKFLAFLSGI